MRPRWFVIGACVVATGCGREPVAVKVTPQPAAAVDASPEPEPAPGNTVSQRPDDPTVCVSGWVTRKGSDPMTFWAITDSAGVVWEVLNADALESARSKGVTFDAPAAVIGRKVPKVPFTGIQVLDVRGGKCPEALVGGA